MPTTTNYGWTTPADTDLVKNGASAIRTLGTAIDTTVFNNASAAIAKTIVDAKGDIIAATAADTVSKLSVGANDTVLTADSSTATGLKWATVANTVDFSLISTTTLSGSQTVTISGLSGYKTLYVITTDAGTAAASNITFTLRINGDTGSNYLRAGVMFVNDGSPVDQTSGTSTSFPFGVEGASATNDLDSTVIIQGANSTGPKMVTVMTGPLGTGATGYVYGGAYSGTSVVSSISIISASGNFNEGTVYIYGAA